MRGMCLDGHILFSYLLFLPFIKNIFYKFNYQYRAKQEAIFFKIKTYIPFLENVPPFLVKRIYVFGEKYVLFK